MTSVADFLRGYVRGYWEGWDFAQSGTEVIEHWEPEAEGEELELKRGGNLSGGADASPPAPPLDLGPLPLRGSLPSSSGSAVESLPAIRQRGLPGEDEVEVAGELERLHAHRGMVAGLRAMTELFTNLGMADAARLCEGAVATSLTEDEAES